MREAEGEGNGGKEGAGKVEEDEWGGTVEERVRKVVARLAAVEEREEYKAVCDEVGG